MTDEQKGGTPPQEGGDAAQQPTAGTPAGDGADAASGKEEVEKLKKELADKEALLLAQKEKVEKANEVLRAQSAQPISPPAGAGAGDPLAQQIAQYELIGRKVAADLQQFPNDTAVQIDALTVGNKLQELYAQRDQRQQQAAWEQRTREAESHFATLPPKVAAKARELFATGQYATGQAAAVAARGASLPDDFDPEAERQRLAKEREELEKDRQAREAGRVGTGSRPLFAGQKPQTNGSFRISRAQLREITAKPYNDPDRVAYNDAYARGAVEVID